MSARRRQLNVRLTEDELRAITDRADRAGVEVSEYVRRRALADGCLVDHDRLPAALERLSALRAAAAGAMEDAIDAIESAAGAPLPIAARRRAR